MECCLKRSDIWSLKVCCLVPQDPEDDDFQKAIFKLSDESGHLKFTDMGKFSKSVLGSDDGEYLQSVDSVIVWLFDGKITLENTTWSHLARTWHYVAFSFCFLFPLTPFANNICTTKWKLLASEFSVDDICHFLFMHQYWSESHCPAQGQNQTKPRPLGPRCWDTLFHKEKKVPPPPPSLTWRSGSATGNII